MQNSLATEAELLTRTFVSLLDFNKGRATQLKERARVELADALREFRHRLLFGTPLAQPNSRAGGQGNSSADGEGLTEGDGTEYTAEDGTENTSRDGTGYTAAQAEGGVDMQISSLAPEVLAAAKARAAAWYHVTYDEEEIWAGRDLAGLEGEDDEDVPTPPFLLSFAWIGVDLLASGK